MRILYTEDERPLREAVKNYLEKFGHKVIACQDGSVAWEKFKSHKVDLCLIDVLMPLMNGNDLVRMIRSVDKNIPIYLFTNFSDKIIYQEALQHGVEGVLVKANTSLSNLVDFLVRIEKDMPVDDLVHKE